MNEKKHKKDDWMKDYNQFDGLVHKGGKLYELDGTLVHENSSSFVQLNGIEVADRNAAEDEQMEAKELSNMKKRQQNLQKIK